MPYWNKLNALLKGKQKWRTFAVILLLIAFVGTILSLLTRLTFLHDDPETRPRLAVVAALHTPAGESMLQGASLYVEHLNQQGGWHGRQLELLPLDEHADTVGKVLADRRVVGVMGYQDAALLAAAAPRLAAAKLPLVSTLAQSGVVSFGLDAQEEARFAANYARNIQQQRMMYVIRENDPSFDALVNPLLEVYQRFDTPVQKVWTLPGGIVDEAQVQKLLAELRDIDVGAIYIATQPELAARLVQGIRASGNLLEIYGPSQLTSQSFKLALRKLSGADARLQSHGIIAATPVLFDTANDDAQRFQIRFQQKFGYSPDWLAVYAYEAANLALTPPADGSEIKGIVGRLNFVAGRATLPIQMGQYNGDDLISAPIQMSPLAKGASFNYIDALRQGRVLYVNDRFMYKTNVVYVGVTVNEISEVNRQKETALLDLSVWFRYRGKFDPQDVQILNAVTPVKFGAPEEVRDSADVQYRRYRLKQTFQMNFTQDARAYNQHIAGLTFRHRELNRNNLRYVADVLGMPSGNAFVTDLHKRRVIKAGTDWQVDNAWFSQDVLLERGDGAPQYVGMTGEQPLYSTVTLGVLLKPEAFAARDVVDAEYFIYIAIFGLLGSLSALLMDARKLGRYWGLQSWLLRVIFWPMLLLAIGNLLIDYAFMHWIPSTTRTIVTVYESAWWLLGARLLDMSIRRFLWVPLEENAKRKVPNVMKVIVTILIFSLAFAGITAVVLNQPLTSLLATSGVLAMVVGFAIQSNIANVFSGIILNIERPFKVGDIIKINNVIGEVKDITWRTIRLESFDGPMVILANSKVSEAQVENMSQLPFGIGSDVNVYTPPEVDVPVVQRLLQQILDEHPAILLKEDPIYKPSARYRGVVNVGGAWVSCFALRYRIAVVFKRSKIQGEVWQAVRKSFLQHGISLQPAGNASEVGEGVADPALP